MTSNDIAIPAAAAQPDRIGQATAVEQSRAIAEVQGAILVAQRCPRNVPAATSSMRESCKQTFLAERAFFDVPRGGKSVTGATVHLARELARCWGNVQYGVSEMRRDDAHGQSEMVAFAWDVQTNTRVETKFVVPHIRDRKAEYGGPVRLTSMDDIYMSNANAGARRVRECIFSILPPWFVEEAKSLCQKTLEHGGGKAIDQRIADAVRLFDEEMGVSIGQLERRIGRPSAKWTARDVASLSTTYQSLHRGEIQVDDVFEPDRLSVDDLGEAPPVPTDKQATETKEAQPATNGVAVSKAMMARLHAHLTDCHVAEAERHATLGLIAGRPITSASELTRDEVGKAIDVLARCAQNDNPASALEYYLSNVGQEGGQS
jgi:hypothetical protein